MRIFRKRKGLIRLKLYTSKNNKLKETRVTFEFLAWDTRSDNGATDENTITGNYDTRDCKFVAQHLMTGGYKP